MLCNRNCKGESCKPKAWNHKQMCNKGEDHLHILINFLWLAFQWPKIDIGSQTYNQKSTLINCKVNQSQFTNTEKKLEDVQESKEKNSWINWIELQYFGKKEILTITEDTYWIASPTLLHDTII